MGPLAIAVSERARRRQPARDQRRLAIRPRRRLPSRRARARSRSQLLRHRHPDARNRHRRVHRRVQHHQLALLTPLPYPDPDRLVMAGRPTRTTATTHSSSRTRCTRTGSARCARSNHLASSRTGPSTWRPTRSPSRSPAPAPRQASLRCSACRRPSGACSRPRKTRAGQKLAVISDSVWRTHLGGDPRRSARRFGSMAKCTK